MELPDLDNLPEPGDSARVTRSGDGAVTRSIPRAAALLPQPPPPPPQQQQQRRRQRQPEECGEGSQGAMSCSSNAFDRSELDAALWSEDGDEDLEDGDGDVDRQEADGFATAAGAGLSDLFGRPAGFPRSSPALSAFPAAAEATTAAASALGLSYYPPGSEPAAAPARPPPCDESEASRQDAPRKSPPRDGAAAAVGAVPCGHGRGSIILAGAPPHPVTIHTTAPAELGAALGPIRRRRRRRGPGILADADDGLQVGGSKCRFLDAYSQGYRGPCA
eukprot:SAG11_NODE_1500_length_4787_cov_1.409556_1_plen_276_part_00